MLGHARATESRTLTVEEFLKLVEDATRRHEYAGGHLFRVDATTTRHNAIIRNPTRAELQNYRTTELQIYHGRTRTRTDEHGPKS